MGVTVFKHAYEYCVKDKGDEDNVIPVSPYDIASPAADH